MAALQWTPDAFATDVERRADGTILLRPCAAIESIPQRLTDKLVEWAQRTPDQVLVARRNREGHWIKVTYQQMLDRVTRLAEGLSQYDLTPGRPILILSGNSIEHLTLSLAAMWIGVPYCPVSPAYSLVSQDHQKLKYIIDLLTPGLIAAFDTGRFAQALRSTVAPDCVIVGDEFVEGRTVVRLEQLEQAPVAALEQRHAATNADTIAKFLLTSGSTGFPKAVITTQRMICSNAVMVNQALPFLRDEPPTVVDWLPWNHTFGGTHDVNAALYNGGALYIDDGKPTPGGIKETIRNLSEISPTVYFNVPKGFEMLVHAMREDAVLRKSFYKNLKATLFAGASLSQHVWDELDACSMLELGFKVPMITGLGCTEASPSITFTTPQASRSGVIGLPASGNVVKLAPVKDKLELRARGSNITPGYWRQPELTTAAFDEEGFYKLGDAVKLIDPQNPTVGLKFDGRIAEDFKLATGTWVSVGPLRAELLRVCAPLLQDVVIAGLDRDYLALLMIPDVPACAAMFSELVNPSIETMATHLALLLQLQTRLKEHAVQNPASSTRIVRAMILPTAPMLDRGEVTDKGSINQRAVLGNREQCIAWLYSERPPSFVISI